MSKVIALLKLSGLMAAETVCIGLFITVPLFFICYTCDMWWGEHLLVRTADRCYMVCLCIGLVTGAVGTWLNTVSVRKKLMGK